MSTDIIKFFEDRLGKDELIPISRLVSAGLYGSLGAVRQALLRGDLTFLKVSRNRTLVYRRSVLEHLRRINPQVSKVTR